MFYKNAASSNQTSHEHQMLAAGLPSFEPHSYGMLYLAFTDNKTQQIDKISLLSLIEL